MSASQEQYRRERAHQRGAAAPQAGATQDHGRDHFQFEAVLGSAVGGPHAGHVRQRSDADAQADEREHEHAEASGIDADEACCRRR